MAQKKTSTKAGIGAAVPAGVQRTTVKILTATRAFLDDPTAVQSVLEDAVERLKKEQRSANSKKTSFVIDRTLQLLAASRPILDQAGVVRELLDGAIAEARKGPGSAQLKQIPVK